jgi:hypothetical protein
MPHAWQMCCWQHAVPHTQARQPTMAHAAVVRVKPRRAASHAPGSGQRARNQRCMRGGRRIRMRSSSSARREPVSGKPTMTQQGAVPPDVESGNRQPAGRRQQSGQKTTTQTQDLHAPGCWRSPEKLSYSFLMVAVLCFLFHLPAVV